MPYMGIQELKDANVKSGSATGDGSTTTFAIGWTPPSAGSLFVTINGVLQSASAYSISASNCVFTAAPVSADAIEFKGIQSSGTVVTLGDGVVNAAQLGSNSVVTASIVDNNVTTDKILDNNVTLAKMAGLTRGSIILGDSSGDPSALALGASTRVLTSDGSDATWAAVAASVDNTPSFRASGGYTAAVSGTWYTMQLSSESWDTDDAFDTGTYRFTVPVGKGGKYVISYMVTANTGSAGQRVIGRVDKNGSDSD